MAHSVIASWLALCSILCATPAIARAEVLRASSQAAAHWSESDVPLSVDPALIALYGPSVREALAEAAQMWSGRDGVPRIVLRSGSDAQSESLARLGRVNWIGIGHGDWPYENRLAVTVSNMDSRTGELLSAQIWINPNQLRALSLEPSAQEFDLRSVLSHELGHFLGLSEAESSLTSLMYPWFRRGEQHARVPSARDRSVLLGLYAQKPRHGAELALGATMPSLSGFGIAGVLLGFGVRQRRGAAAPASTGTSSARRPKSSPRATAAARWACLLHAATLARRRPR